MSYLADFQSRFEGSFLPYIDSKRTSALPLHRKAVTPFNLIGEFVQNGGKRFRPALFYYAYDRRDKGFDPLVFSFVFELFHTFALIHDDIIDHAPLRRGRETVNKRYGLGEAVLTGDLSLMLADEIFYSRLPDAQVPPAAKHAAHVLYNRYKQELILGQYLDYIHIPETSTVMTLKTSLYSFVRPVKFGFLLSGREAEFEEWEALLGKLGTVFQMKDDYEGVFSDEKKLGKSVLSDIAEGKNTVIVEAFKKKATEEELETFMSFFGKSEATERDLAWFRRTLDEKGLRAWLRETIAKETERVRHLLGKTANDHLDLHGLVEELLGLISTFS